MQSVSDDELLESMLGKRFLPCGLALLLSLFVGKWISNQQLNGQLSAAVSGRDSEQVKALLKLGADANANGPKDVKPLTWATNNGDVEMMKLLLDAGADPTCRGGWLPALDGAAAEGNVAAVDLLLERGADPNYDFWSKHHGSWALVLAVENGYPQVVKSLLKHGADPNTRDRSGNPVLTLARKRKSSVMVEALIASGAK